MNVTESQMNKQMNEHTNGRTDRRKLYTPRGIKIYQQHPTQWIYNSLFNEH